MCLPRGPLAALTDAELDPVLSHELAHLERGDGLWFPVVGALQAVFWLNPLNHWLASRFRESAELACDDRAVELTGNPLGLARALVHVASRAPFARRPSLLPSIAYSKSALLPRVRRLTIASPEVVQRTGGRERLWAVIIIAAPSALLSVLSIQVLPAQLPAKTIPPVSRAERSGRRRVAFHGRAEPTPGGARATSRYASLPCSRQPSSDPPPLKRAAPRQPACSSSAKSCGTSAQLSFGSSSAWLQHQNKGKISMPIMNRATRALLASLALQGPSLLGCTRGHVVRLR